MGLLSFLDPNRESRESLEAVQRKLQDMTLEVAMIEHGWTPIPEGMAEEQQNAVLGEFWEGKEVPLYPPGYTEPPVITEGKLKAEPMEEEEKPRWRFW